MVDAADSKSVAGNGVLVQVRPGAPSAGGIGLMIFGALVTLLAAWRYDAVNRQIEAGLVKTNRALVWFSAAAVSALSVALIIYMFIGASAQ